MHYISSLVLHLFNTHNFPLSMTCLLLLYRFQLKIVSLKTRKKNLLLADITSVILSEQKSEPSSSRQLFCFVLSVSHSG